MDAQSLSLRLRFERWIERRAKPAAFLADRPAYRPLQSHPGTDHTLLQALINWRRPNEGGAR
jgi:hypothetical protein